MPTNAAHPLQVVETQSKSALVVVCLDIPLVWEYLGNDYKRVQMLSCSRQLRSASRTTRATIHTWHNVFAEIDKLQQARDDREQTELDYAIIQEVDPPRENSLSWSSWMFSSN
jgi:hypothetical protein